MAIVRKRGRVYSIKRIRPQRRPHPYRRTLKPRFKRARRY